MISHQTIDKRGLAYATAIVEHIEADPARQAVKKARERCQRWMKNVPSPELIVWDTLLSRPWQEIKKSLLDLSEQGDRLRQNNPFCGVLTPQERWSIHRAFRHHET
jgi:hypothetical protein